MRTRLNVTLGVSTRKKTFMNTLLANFVDFASLSDSSLPKATQSAITCSKLRTRTRCEICSKLTIKKPERRQWRRCGVLIVNFQHI